MIHKIYVFLCSLFFYRCHLCGKHKAHAKNYRCWTGKLFTICDDCFKEKY